MSVKVAIVPVTAYQQNCSIVKCEATGKRATNPFVADERYG